jgi:hypothetical protein
VTSGAGNKKVCQPGCRSGVEVRLLGLGLLAAVSLDLADTQHPHGRASTRRRDHALGLASSGRSKARRTGCARTCRRAAAPGCLRCTSARPDPIGSTRRPGYRQKRSRRQCVPLSEAVRHASTSGYFSDRLGTTSPGDSATPAFARAMTMPPQAARGRHRRVTTVRVRAPRVAFPSGVSLHRQAPPTFERMAR